MRNHISPLDPVSYDLATVAVASNPDLNRAKVSLEDQGYTDISIPALETIKRNKGPELEQIRAEMGPKLEKALTADMLDEARFATEVIELAIKRTQERLERNIVSDPAKVARDLSQLRTQAIDKKLALEGRPTSITETRSADEIIRQLEAMGVAKTISVEATVEDA